ncbi:MAG: hypothetical protein BEN18_04635 [Epulopiscium sp. Nuni2H_MBin001]|nr:MAG: hypothetical protein BEN18_04635 [Epulopiscium sp. Nuni2H_MBin001]
MKHILNIVLIPSLIAYNVYAATSLDSNAILNSDTTLARAIDYDMIIKEQMEATQEVENQIKSEIDGIEQELETNKEAIAEATQELNQNLQQQSQTREDVELLDLAVIEVENEILQIEQDLEVTKQQIELTADELVAAKVSLDNHYEETKERMVTMYKNNRRRFIEILFSSDTLTQLLSRSIYISRIADYDDKLMRDFATQHELVIAKQQQFDLEYMQIGLLHEKAVVKKEELISLMEHKVEQILELENAHEVVAGQISALELAGAELEEQISAMILELTKLSEVQEELQNAAEDENAARIAAQAALATAAAAEAAALGYTSSSSNIFSWPVPGQYYISSQYNSRSNPISGLTEFHQGIDIPAPYGTTVVAAAAGKVITAGWVNGYGYTVMIDHGSGLVTLYAHNSSLNVSVGQLVAQGQNIAGVGSTGYSTGNHCHFEVRLNGEHTNPWYFLED